MNPFASGAAGGVAGGILGQLDPVLGAPRRAIQGMVGSAIGAPEAQSGSELLKAMFGVDPQSAEGQFGGMAADMAMDPLTYLGALGGGGAGVLSGEGAIAKELADLDKIEAGTQAAMARNGAMESYSPVGQMGMTPLDSMLPENVSGMMPEASRTFPNAGAMEPADPRMAQGIKNNPFLRQTAAANPGMARADLGDVRSKIMSGNGNANTGLLTDAMSSLPEEWQQMGGTSEQGRPQFNASAMLDPSEDYQQSPLANMSPEMGMSGIEPLRARLVRELESQGQLSPTQKAAILGIGAGSIGGGVAANYNR